MPAGAPRCFEMDAPRKQSVPEFFRNLEEMIVLVTERNDALLVQIGWIALEKRLRHTGSPDRCKTASSGTFRQQAHCEIAPQGVSDNGHAERLTVLYRRQQFPRKVLAEFRAPHAAALHDAEWARNDEKIDACHRIQLARIFELHGDNVGARGLPFGVRILRDRATNVDHHGDARRITGSIPVPVGIGGVLERIRLDDDLLP